MNEELKYAIKELGAQLWEVFSNLVDLLFPFSIGWHVWVVTHDFSFAIAALLALWMITAIYNETR